MTSCTGTDLRSWALAGAVGLLFLAATGGLSVSAAVARDDPAAVVGLSSRWVASVAEKAPGLTELVSSDGAVYYGNLRDLALRGSVGSIDALHPVDQLQVMFLRLTIPSGRLAKLSGDEVLLLAVEEGWIGQDLRRSDELREVVLRGDTATGRLFKFGLENRPDRGRQYFSYEDGVWRVQLRGERERLENDFRSFTRRTGLSDSEAAFFILETRLLRKVVPADFVAPDAVSAGLVAPVSRGRVGLAAADVLERDVAQDQDARPRLEARRLIAVRESPGNPELAAATIADVDRSLRYVVMLGDFLGDGSGYRLERVDEDRVWLKWGDERVVLALDPESPPLAELHRTAGAAVSESSLLDHAKLGEDRVGMMSQWRNTGLRGRPQLLQQGSLVPEIARGGDEISGLRVGRALPGSFWDQLGLSEGDVIREVNGREVNSMIRWRELMGIAENAQEISLLVQRGEREVRFITRTIPPRREGAGA